jgi:hypothetical protein
MLLDHLGLWFGWNLSAAKHCVAIGGRGGCKIFMAALGKSKDTYPTSQDATRYIPFNTSQLSRPLQLQGTLQPMLL